MSTQGNFSQGGSTASSGAGDSDQNETNRMDETNATQSDLRDSDVLSDVNATATGGTTFGSSATLGTGLGTDVSATTPIDADSIMDSSARDEDTLVFETRDGMPSSMAPVPGSSSGNGSMMDQAKDKASGALSKTKEVAGQALDKAKETTGQVYGQAKDQVKSRLTEQKGKAAESLTSVTDALTQTGASLRTSGNEPIARLAEGVAGHIDQLATSLRDKDVDEITVQMQDFARRNPALFIGGALLAGVALGRFLRASEQSATASSSASSSKDYGDARTSRLSDPMTGIDANLPAATTAY